MNAPYTSRSVGFLAAIFFAITVPTTIVAIFLLDSSLDVVLLVYAGTGVFILAAAMFVVLRNASDRFSDAERAYLQELMQAASREGTLTLPFTHNPAVGSPREYDVDQVRLLLVEPRLLMTDAALRGRLDDLFVRYYESFLQADEPDREQARILLAAEFGFSPVQIAEALDIDRSTVLASLEAQLRRVADDIHAQASAAAKPDDDDHVHDLAR